MMLRHAHVPQTSTRGHLKQAPCTQCGALTPYTSKPRKYCDACHPDLKARVRSATYKRALKTKYAGAASKALAQELEKQPPIPPGFCACCGIIRLSAANRDGRCDGCADD